ncbi:hypothetical protein PO124_30495 [Bacillus licheniformis]|nr:hypothetical protein [Bacillus licheniformis]
MESTAKAKGFTALERGVPIVGTAVTFASNLTEYTDPENSDKVCRKTGRFAAGVGTDILLFLQVLKLEQQ